MKENYMVCNCKQVSYANIADALENFEKFDDVLSAFKSNSLFYRLWWMPSESFGYNISNNERNNSIILKSKKSREICFFYN